MGSNSASNGDTADFGRTTPTKKEKKKTASVEIGLGTDRMSNYSVSQGGTRQDGNGGGAIASTGQVVQAPKVISPTTAEVSQSAATDAEDPLYLRKKRVKAVGRSPTIMTGVTGVTEGLTLGKPSLLGR